VTKCEICDATFEPPPETEWKGGLPHRRLPLSTHEWRFICLSEGQPPVFIHREEACRDVLKARLDKIIIKPPPGTPPRGADGMTLCSYCEIPIHHGGPFTGKVEIAGSVYHDTERCRDILRVRLDGEIAECRTLKARLDKIVEAMPTFQARALTTGVIAGRAERVAEGCGCVWTTDHGASVNATIGEAVPGLDPCAGHRAAIERAYRNGYKDASGLSAPETLTMAHVLRAERVTPWR
jgi:hypothetical protein